VVSTPRSACPLVGVADLSGAAPCSSSGTPIPYPGAGPLLPAANSGSAWHGRGIRTNEPSYNSSSDDAGPWRIDPGLSPVAGAGRDAATSSRSGATRRRTPTAPPWTCWMTQMPAARCSSTSWLRSPAGGTVWSSRRGRDSLGVDEVVPDRRPRAATHVTTPGPGTRSSTCARRRRTSVPGSDALRRRVAMMCAGLASSTHRERSGRSACTLYPSADHIER